MGWTENHPRVSHSLVPRLPDLFNVHKKKLAWYLNYVTSLTDGIIKCPDIGRLITIDLKPAGMEW